MNIDPRYNGVSKPLAIDGASIVMNYENEGRGRLVVTFNLAVWRDKKEHTFPLDPVVADAMLNSGLLKEDA